MNRRAFLAALATLPAAAAHAHHGVMRWDKSEIYVIEGWISNPMDGFPHWEISVRVGDVDWEVDVGGERQLRKAGFKPDGSEFSHRKDIKVEGYRPWKKDRLLILPVRITLDGVTREIKIRG